jgi:hypothetical protein
LSRPSSLRLGDATVLKQTLGIALGALCVAAVACSARQRPRMSEAELIEARDRYLSVIATENEEDLLLGLDRGKREIEAHAADPSAPEPRFDVLIISGGGDYGAFGAGFLKGWGAVEDPQWRRPEFDLVTGVSTGALIAPFAFIGDEDAYRRILNLYREPKKDWFNLKGLLFFLPTNESFLSIDGLARDIDRELDEELIRRIVAEREKGRLLQISATNVDLGMRRVWDLGREGKRALEEEGSLARVHDRMRASSAIPAAFPPVEIDGYLYVDGAVTSNILYNANMRSPSSAVHRWKQLNPDTPLPPFRFWVIVNNQLTQIPQVTSPTWVGVTASVAGSAVRAATATALELLASEVAYLNATGAATAELFVVAIPDYWRPPTSGVFQKETMDSLADLGEKLGRQPASWRKSTILNPDPAEPLHRRSEELAP